MESLSIRRLPNNIIIIISNDQINFGDQYMGNIRHKNIKNITFRLLDKYEGVFTGDFDENKHLVTKYTDIQSKVIRNRVAGYVTRKITHVQPE